MKKPAMRYTFGLLAIIGTGLLQTNASAGQRPIDDFLSRQGKFCLQLDAMGNVDCSTSHYTDSTTGGGCFLFIPPVADYTGWFDPRARAPQLITPVLPMRRWVGRWAPA